MVTVERESIFLIYYIPKEIVRVYIATEREKRARKRRMGYIVVSLSQGIYQ